MDSRENDNDDLMIYHAGCDESKCVSRGRSNLYNSSFTCYGGDDGTLFPRMCADGYLPVVVEGDNAIDPSLSYFTCCPPHATLEATRHCSDPITPEFAIDDEDENAGGICDGYDTQNYARRMKRSSEENPSSFLCCDIDTTTTEDGNNTVLADDFLDDLECVPYRNEFYEPAQVQNKIGKLDVAFCELDDIGFEFARPIDDDYNIASNGGWYQCCKTGPALPPFSKDTAFNITVYTTILLFWIAAILSAIVAVGLVIPLLIELRNNYREERGISSTFRWSIFASRLSRNSSSRRDNSRGDSSRGGSIPRGTIKNPKYSSYNLYLVYLAVCDLVFSSYSIWEYQRYINQSFDITLWVTIAVSPPSMNDANTIRDEPTIAPYMLANMWINAFICHEVFVLLRTSHSMRRIKQPSLTKVNLQAGGSCLAAIAFGIFATLLYEPAWEARNNGDFGPKEDLDSKVRMPMLIVSAILPLLYVICVSFLIWWRGYIPSLSGATARKRAMRELAFYFFRIVAVFIGIWLPRGFLISWADRTGQKWADLVAQYVVAIQPILTTCLVLTKSDAKKYIQDLVTLSYFFEDGNCCTNCRTAKFKEQQEPDSKVESAAGTGTGFSCDADRDADEAGEEDGDSDSGGDDEEAADSLIFSVLGFRLDDASGRDHGGNLDAESGTDTAVVTDNVADGGGVDATVNASTDLALDA